MRDYEQVKELIRIRLNTLRGFHLAFNKKVVYTCSHCGNKWEIVGRRIVTGVSPLIRKAELMFLGQFYHNLDSKARLTIPTRFRDMLANNGAYILQGFEQNLLVLPSPTFEVVSQRINHMSMTNPKTRLLRRLFFSTANYVDVDKSGRILIPHFLRQSASLESEVVVVGNGAYFEIWSPEYWSSQAEQIQDTQTNANRFAELDLTSE